MNEFKMLKNLYCESCKQQFFIKDLMLKGSRCPLLLYCGHSMCESCIQHILKGVKTLSCLECSSSSFMDTKDLTIKNFSVNAYLAGSLLAFQSSRHEKDKKFALLSRNSENFNYEDIGISDQNFKPKLNEFVCEECSLTALWYCDNCKSDFCEICWSRVHSAAKSLMKHSKTPVKKASKISLKKCPEHETQDLEFFCKGCSTTVCSHCVILRHQGEGHSPITLKEKNVEMISSVRTAAEEAEKICKQMKHTLQKLNYTQSSVEVPDKRLLDMACEIRRNFSQLHGLLQLEEERLLKELQHSSNDMERCVQVLRKQLEKQIEDVERLLDLYAFVVTKPQGCDLVDLHRQLEQVQNFPCYLISQKTCNKEAKVTFNPQLIELLPIYCSIDLPSSQVFELRSSLNLPSGYTIEPVNEIDSKGGEKVTAIVGSESSASDVESLSNGFTRDSEKAQKAHPESLSPKSWPKAPTVFRERRNYSVRVTYIKHPGEFYVALNSQRFKQQAIEKRSAQFATTEAEVPKAVAKDEIYLVKYKVDGKWYRARVVEVLPSKKMGDQQCVKIYYLDYGNSEIVALSRLRTAPPETMEPPLAIKCKLFDCVPKDEEWCVESTKTMDKILNNHTATMYVMEVHRDCLEVDLSVFYPEGQIGRDIVSVRDALLFLEFSNFVHGSKVPRNTNALKYPHQYLPSAGETFDIIITHVVSPSEFYLQKVGRETNFLCELTIDLQKYYSENPEKNFIYNPVVGMPCAALFSVDHSWYRAKIVDIPGKKMLTVFYVDYGNTETLSWTRIRKLKENFVRRPPLALNCGLARVDQTENFWSAETKAYLEKCVMVGNCRVYVKSRPKSKMKLKVILYKQVNKKEVCVNTLLDDIASSTNASRPSRTLRLEEDAKQNDENDEVEVGEQLEVEDEVDEILSEINNSRPDEENLNSDLESERMTFDIQNYLFEPIRPSRGQNRSKLVGKLREWHEPENKDFAQASSHEELDNEVDECTNNIFKIKVEVLLAESPSCIYVTFPALTEELKCLQSKMEEFYRNTPPIEEDWAVGSMCAVFVPAKDSWFRASVLSSLPEHRVKVFLKDVAQVSVEPEVALRKLDPSFIKYISCSVKCHLADVAPPGGQWPCISSEYLQNELEKYNEVYMTKRGQIKNKSLPVELWVQKIVLRGALEPITKEWITLNRLLVRQGLAVPVKQILLYSSVLSNDVADKENSEIPTEAKDLACAKEEPSTEVFSEASNALNESVPSLGSTWLPPDPLKVTRFTGVPTYVDFEGHVHLYEDEEDGKKLKLMQETLLAELKDSAPEEYFWSPGEICNVKFHVDNLWYRGLISEVEKDGTYNVLFVDYGNTETCQSVDLRKTTKMLNIPILSHKIQLHGITSISEDGKWSVEVTDLLHSLVVDKKCEVCVFKLASGPNEPHIGTLKLLENNVDVGSLLVNQGWASLECPEFCDKFDSEGSSPREPINEVTVSKEDRESELSACYTSLNLPDDVNELFIQVTYIKSETEFYGLISEREPISSSLKKILKEFEDLQQKLTEECRSLPHLEEHTKGQPCCCFNVKNNKWCRGEIENVKKNLVTVFYVDFGHRVAINKSFVFECKKDWLCVPKMSMKFKLATVERCPNVSKSLFMKTLTSCLSRNVLFAEILSKQEDFFEVKTWTEKNGSLAYQEMIDKNMMSVKSK